MHYLLNWSGGKDSTASIIVAHEHQEPLDIIIFAEAMFDRKNGISGENPEHIRFIRQTAIPQFEKWGYRVVVLRARRDYLSFFHRVIEHPSEYLDHKGKKFGFPVTRRCGIKRDMKVRPIEKYCRSFNGQVKQYMGICADEKSRLTSMHQKEGAISLLKKYNIAQDMTAKICASYGLLSPAYKLSKRGGCWFCPYAKLEEQREIKKMHPEAWETFVSLEEEENLANRRYNIYGKTLHEIDMELKAEKEERDE